MANSKECKTRFCFSLLSELFRRKHTPLFIRLSSASIIITDAKNGFSLIHDKSVSVYSGNSCNLYICEIKINDIKKTNPYIIMSALFKVLPIDNQRSTDS